MSQGTAGEATGAGGGILRRSFETSAISTLAAMMDRRLALASIVLAGTLVANAESAVESIEFGPFGAVALYRNSQHPSRVVLFVSGDGGWNLGVVDMAEALASLDALVVGIDITAYQKSLASAKGSCSYPAADFEALSQFVQKKLGYPNYVSPILVGYSSGATLVYAILVQAPTGTFGGAISMGFCPDLPLTKPLCRGNGLEWKAGPKGKGVSFEPAPRLETPWIAFQGSVDQVCDPKSVQEYVQKVGGARIVLLDKVGHGFSVQRNWMPQFKTAFADLTPPRGAPKPAEVDLTGLPLVEVEAQGTSDVFALLLSGDGGWVGLDRELASAMAAEGVPVVGLDSLRYFWTRRTPEGAAADLANVLSHYLSRWNKRAAVLVGYSLGADVLPFLANRLSPDLAARLRVVALLGPSPDVDFEFHLTDWLPGTTRPDNRPVLPEAQKLTAPRLLCVYGTEETDSLCRKLDAARWELMPLEGSHHFGGNYDAIARALLAAARE